MESLIKLPMNLVHRFMTNPKANAQPVGGVRFDWLMVGLAGWILAGLSVDGWAHNHHFADTTFFTPWHALLYSGFLAAAAGLWIAFLRNVRRGCVWSNAAPLGYGWSLIGVLIFSFGGVADLIWHTLFGIEVSVDALYSPTHLILAVGGALIMIGPFRAGWNRSSVGWPMLLSLGYVLAVLSFFSAPFHPFNEIQAAGVAPPRALYSDHQALGVASILLHTIITLGTILLVLRRASLPLGGATFLIAFSSALATLNNENNEYWIIPAAVLGGIAADVLLIFLKPSPVRLLAWRLYAFLVPTILYLFYFLDVILVRGTWWSVHLWVGSIVLAGIAGLLLSYAFVDGRLVRVLKEA